MRKLLAALVVLATAGLAGCGYNDIQRSDEQVKAAWAEVLNQYQRRAGPLPNLSKNTKGGAAPQHHGRIPATDARPPRGPPPANAPPPRKPRAGPRLPPTPRRR